MSESPYISCQINFYPLYTEKVGEKVKEVISIIEETGLQTEKNPLSTIVYGRSNEIYEILDKITKKMTEEDVEFSMNCSISNSCGCEI
ncbi:MAG: YkoF family thiamine/hydroxymethylpyrimidine-binding protein [Halanaerobium sp.]